MSRESSPEEGEIVEEGEIAPEPSSSSREAGELEGATEPAPVQASHRLENGDGRVDGRQRSSSRGKLNHDPGVRQGDRGNRHDRGSYGPSHRGSSDSSRDRATAVQLTEQLKELLKRTRIAEANRNATSFCTDLKRALQMLAQVHDLYKGGATRISDAAYSDLSWKVFTGIRALQIVSTTGAGKTSLPGNSAAVAAVQFARDHVSLFPPPQQQEFRGWCGTGKVFGALASGELLLPPVQKQQPARGSQQQRAATNGSGRRSAAVSNPQPPRPPPQQLPKPVTLPPPVLPKPGRPPMNSPPPPRTLPAPGKAPSFRIKWPQQPPQPPASEASGEVRLNPNLAAKLARFPNGKGGPQLPPGNPPPRHENGNARQPSRSGAVPGLDVDAGEGPRRARKRARVQPAEEALSDDESDLYAAGQGTNSASQSDLPPSVPQAELEDEDMGPLPPGIDVEPGTQQAASGGGGSGKPPLISISLEPDEELEKEVARLFGQEHARLSPSGATTLQSQPAETRSTGDDDAVQKLLSEGKLCLVLDLDHTLVNSARWGEVDPEDSNRLEDFLEREQKLPFERQSLHSLEAIHMWTKLRPACRQLLAALAEKYVMWIHTNGNRQYAEAVCGLLDPNGELFGSRVVANGGVSPHDPSGAIDLIKRLDAQGLAGLEPITVIVDDTASVWPGHTENLMLVERYCYFPSSAKQLGLGHSSLLQNNRDESPDQGMLSVVKRVLLELHAEALGRYADAYSGRAAPPWDVRGLLEELRSKVLEGVRILFSRLWPTDTRSEDAPLWKLALQLGAQCTTALDEAVTHVVTNTRYTEKAQKALQQGKHVVSQHWLEASAIMWEHMAESTFPVSG